ncbi:MAG: transcriptional regulator [Phycisphaerales bacterium]|nr:transcriptional regulator [Phycisphaerales bacterium]
MSFDSLIANPGRLSILTALAVEAEVEFVHLRRVTKLTDGNLSCHAKRLATAGLVDIDKSFRQGKPVTSMKLTPQGRTALESHVRRLLSAMSHRRLESGPAIESTPQTTPDEQQSAITVMASDEWID